MNEIPFCHLGNGLTDAEPRTYELVSVCRVNWKSLGPGSIALGLSAVSSTLMCR